MENYVNMNVMLIVRIRHVTGLATACLDVQSTTTAHSASSNALITAMPPIPTAAVTTKETVYTDVSTDLQVTTVTQVREC